MNDGVHRIQPIEVEVKDVTVNYLGPIINMVETKEPSVDHAHGVPVVDQNLGKDRADKPRAPGYKNFQYIPLVMDRRTIDPDDAARYRRIVAVVPRLVNGKQ